MKSKILIFTATYNEADNIEIWYLGVRSVAPDAFILIVDDNSIDGTNEKLTAIQRKDPNFKLITRAGKLGLASAHRISFDYALREGFDFLITMDADLSHIPEEINLLLDKANIFDFVIGTRRAGGKTDYKGWRRFLSRSGNILAQILIPTGLSEYTTSFRLFNSKAFSILTKQIPTDEGYAFFIEVVELLHINGLKLGEVPIHFRDRLHGKSKIPRMQIIMSSILLGKLGTRRLLVCLRRLNAGFRKSGT